VSGVRVAPPVLNNIAAMKLILYIKEAYNELMHKVTWPTWEELQGSAIVVMVASVVIAIVIAIMDVTFRNLMSGIYSMFYR
jgi:preprotein translocase subunit SecE